MIYTVTFNPSLDYVVDVKTFKTGQVNRTEQEKMFPGGKGINVSIVLNHLGLKSTAWGFLAGFTGEEISKRLDEEGVNTDFIQVEKGISRINVKLRSTEETEINGQGPMIRSTDIEKLYAKLDTLKTGDVLACVSYPGYNNNLLVNDMDTDYYAKLSMDQSSPFFNKATHDCRRCNQRTSGKCTSASSIPD